MKRLQIGDVSIFEQTNYDFNVSVVPGKALQMKLSYNAHVYDATMIERLQGIWAVNRSCGQQTGMQISNMELLDGSREAAHRE